MTKQTRLIGTDSRDSVPKRNVQHSQIAFDGNITIMRVSIHRDRVKRTFVMQTVSRAKHDIIIWWNFIF